MDPAKMLTVARFPQGMPRPYIYARWNDYLLASPLVFGLLASPLVFGRLCSGISEKSHPWYRQVELGDEFLHLD